MLPGLRDVGGRAYVNSGAPPSSAAPNGGILVSPLGVLHITPLAPQYSVNGFAVRTLGQLAVQFGGVISSWQQGLPFTSDGSLVAQLNTVPAATDPYVGGLRVGPLGGVYMTDIAPP